MEVELVASAVAAEKYPKELISFYQDRYTTISEDNCVSINKDRYKLVQIKNKKLRSAVDKAMSDHSSKDVTFSSLTFKF